MQIGDDGALQLAPAVDRPRLSQPELEARQLLEYGKMAPTLVRVPMSAAEISEFKKKAAAKPPTTSLSTRNPEMAECASSAQPIEQWTDKQVEDCAGYAHYAHKQKKRKAKPGEEEKVVKGGQWASGGGFDIASKAAAVHRVIDGIRISAGATRHVVIGSGYEAASPRYFHAKLLAAFDDFETVTLTTEASAAKLLAAPRRRRIATLVGSTVTEKQKQRIKQIFFSNENADGSIIEVLVVDASMLTGFNAPGATHLHIMSPVLNQQQAWSRILRRCAQPVAQSTVYVYTYKTYIAQPGTKITVTPDEMVLEGLRRKHQTVEPVDLMMQEMIRNSYDRYWFAEYSSGGAIGGGGAAGAGAARVQPLTQQEYIISVVFQTFKPKPERVVAAQEEPHAAPVNQLHRFAQDFFIGQPWVMAHPAAFARRDVATTTTATTTTTAETILQQLISLVDMNLMVDMPLLTAFIAENLSAAQRNEITALLEEKARVTPPQLLRSFDDYLALQEVANDHYQRVLHNVVALAQGYADETEALNDAARSSAPPATSPPPPPATSATSSVPSPSSPATPPLPQFTPAPRQFPASAESSPSGSPPSPLTTIAPTTPTTPVAVSPETEFGTPLSTTPQAWKDLVANVVRTPVAGKTPTPSPDVGQRVTYPRL
jgi:hypothetical protein